MGYIPQNNKQQTKSNSKTLAEIDLHIHSTQSDGDWNPWEIAKYAINKGLKTIAITDHNTINGSLQLEKYLKETNQYNLLETIPGAEITTQLKGFKFHLLAYMNNPDPESIRTINTIFEEIKNIRINRKDILIRKMRSLGFHISEDDIKNKKDQYQNDYSIIKDIFKNEKNIHKLKEYEITTNKEQRQNIKKKIKTVLRIKYGIKNINDYYKNIKNIKKEDQVEEPYQKFFKTFIKSGTENYIKKEIIPFETVQKKLRKAKSLIVPAHPFSRYTYMDEERIKELINKGIDGIECYSISSKYWHRIELEKIAKKNDLILTGGSDFHSKISHYWIGQYNPKNLLTHEIIDKMKEQWETIYG